MNIQNSKRCLSFLDLQIQHNTNEQLENKVEVLIPTPFKKCSLCTPITIAHIKSSGCVSSAKQGRIWVTSKVVPGECKVGFGQALGA